MSSPPGYAQAAVEQVADVASDPSADRTARRVIPQRHPWRWVAAAGVAVLAAMAINALITNPFFQWDRFGYWFTRPVVLQGLWITLKVTAAAAVLGFIGALVLAVARLSSNPLLRAASWAYTWLFRSIPLIVILLFLVNFGALYKTISLGVPFGPEFVRFDESRLATDIALAIIGLSLAEAAYGSEVVRAGILSVDQGQHEAAAALGLPKRYQFRRIVLPQALRSIVPNFVNQLIGLIKASSLVFYVSLLDLFGQVQTLGSTYPGDIIPLLLVATVWYVILTSALSVVQFYVERHYARGAVRTLPPTPLQRLRAVIGRKQVTA
ncbi:amino acid ABC transporter permease [Branchiibius cervicis]|uniref:Amino acid ABC transporter permease n=1 Tax=Branchiibius cervicis TaxID=908252 RepID=A0ABW2AN73_9MICO